MSRATDRELNAAKRVAEAITEFLIAWEEGRQLRMPEQPKQPVELKLPDWPPVPTAETPRDTDHSQADPGQLIGVKALGELVGCSSRHIYRLTDSGRLPRPRKLGNLVRWSLLEIRKWVEDGCPKALGKVYRA